MYGNKNMPVFGPLKGVKIVHATASVAGPFGAQLLADWGADMLWLENSLAPDVMRRSPTYYIEAERRNQRNLALDTRSPEGREVLTRLLKEVDVLIESSKGGQWERWGLTDDVLWEINPRLVICHLSGFGQTGLPDYVSRPSYDVIAQAFGGYVDLNRNTLSDPYAIQSVGDFFSAVYIAASVCAALISTKETGKGESIDIAQYELLMRMFVYGADWFTTRKPIDWSGNPIYVAGVGSFKCRDDNWILASIAGPGVLKKAIELFGLEYGSEDFPEGISMVLVSQPNGQIFLDALQNYCSARTADEVAQAFAENGVPGSKINTLADLEVDPHVIARNMVEELTTFKGAKMRYVGVVPKFKNNPGKTWRPAPYWGMDNEEILKELGYGEEEIASFYEKGVIDHDPEMKMCYPYEKFGE